MALNPSNSSNLEQLALKGLTEYGTTLHYISIIVYYKPHEVLDGWLCEEEDKVKDVINNQPSHVFCITQVLALNTQQSVFTYSCTTETTAF